jgi:quinol monooxygenase YgiN
MTRIVTIFLIFFLCTSSHLLASENPRKGKKMNENILCVATFTAKKGNAEKLRFALRALIEPTRKEEGCISYVLYEGIENPNLFTMIEKFTDRKSFDFHSQQPYLVNFKESAGELIESVSVNLHKIVE